jgi:hypothetical protein
VKVDGVVEVQSLVVLTGVKQVSYFELKSLVASKSLDKVDIET